MRHLRNKIGEVQPRLTLTLYTIYDQPFQNLYIHRLVLHEGRVDLCDFTCAIDVVAVHIP